MNNIIEDYFNIFNLMKNCKPNQINRVEYNNNINEKVQTKKEIYILESCII